MPTGRSCPAVRDLDGDGKKDLLTGDTNGQLLFYSNAGTDDAPSFSGYTLVESDGTAIDLPGTPRSRPFVCDWTGDGEPDVLVGAGDGKVHLYQGIADAAVPTVSEWGMMVFGLLIVLAGTVVIGGRQK